MDYVAGPYGAKATRTPVLAVLALLSLASFGHGLADRMGPGPMAGDTVPAGPVAQSTPAPGPDPNATARLAVAAAGPPAPPPRAGPRQVADAPRPPPAILEADAEPVEPVSAPAADEHRADAAFTPQAVPEPPPADSPEDPVS